MSDEQLENTQHWYTDVVTSRLLAAARQAYINNLRAELAEAGLDDLPRRGPFILGAIANHGSTLTEAVEWLHISRQAASQLVDALVLRGYLDRAPDPRDRRRITVSLTERGRAAAQITRDAGLDVDNAIRDRVGEEALATTRSVLAAMAELGRREHVS